MFLTSVQPSICRLQDNLIKHVWGGGGRGRRVSKNTFISVLARKVNLLLPVSSGQEKKLAPTYIELSRGSQSSEPIWQLIHEKRQETNWAIPLIPFVRELHKYTRTLHCNHLLAACRWPIARTTLLASGPGELTKIARMN